MYTPYLPTKILDSLGLIEKSHVVLTDIELLLQ